MNKPVSPGALSSEPEWWSLVTTRLRADIGDAKYDSWFLGLQRGSEAADTLHVSVATPFLRSWITRYFLQEITRAVHAARPDIKTVVVETRAATRAHTLVRPTTLAIPVPEKRDATPDAGQQKEPASQAWSMPTAQLLALEEYIEGEANAAAMHSVRTLLSEVSERIQGPNPVLLYGPTGCGKTHLLQGIARNLSERRVKALYLTNEKFMYGVVDRLRNTVRCADVFGDVDVLIIDDIHFITGKVSPAEFGRLMHHLIASHTRVMLASDHPAHEIENLDETTRALINGGISAELKQPKPSLRKQILELALVKARARQPGFELSEAVLLYVAQAIDGSGRDLYGAMNRLLARYTLSGQEITVSDAEQAIRDLVRLRDPKKVKIDDIQKLVASHFNVSRADLLSSRRTASVVRPRQIAMYLAKKLTPRSLPEIGRRFGGRDHTTVLHAVRKIESLKSGDTSLRESLVYIERLLTET